MNKFWITNQLANNTAEILIYGYIGDDEVNAGDFVRELRALEAAGNSRIDIRMNSGGGSVFDGLAIFNAIKNCKAKTVGYIDGICASMCTVIAVACTEVHMSSMAMFMTHRASAFAMGNANDMRSTAQMMEALEGVICSAYAAKTGKTQEECKTAYLTGEDRWFTSSEALSEKLIDSVFVSASAVAPPKEMKDTIQLVGFFNSTLDKFQTNNMKQFTLTAEQLAVLNLGQNADVSAVVNAINALNNRAVTAEGKLQAADAAKAKAETDLANLQASTVEKDVHAMLEKALNVDKKITAEGKGKLTVQFKGNPDGLKAVLEVMSPIVSITDAIDKNKGLVTGLAAKTWDQLDKEGKLEEYKTADLDGFKAKYKEQFGKEYTGA